MFALVDCNNFFVSAERVFRPDLRNSPVCVLSNNDGCIVALSNEAKAIGLKRGDPYFKVRDIINRHNVAIFSSNYSLYAGMSARVMRILTDRFFEVEIYSIDEAFINLEGDAPEVALQKMRELRRVISRWTGIPVSIGIAPTKTLAKVAGHFAKHFAGYKGVCLMDTDEKRRKALQMLPVNEVWGIGRQFRKKLEAAAIHTAWDFSQMSSSWVRHHFGITGLRTCQELQGIPCVESAEIETKKSICTSRSFGTVVTEKSELLASIVHFTTACAQKLRKQSTVANIISIFIATDRFKTELPQYKQFATVKTLVATADTSELIVYARKMLDHIYRPGYQYKRAGVIVSGIVGDDAVQQNFFDDVQHRERRQQLFQAIDKINSADGGGTVQFAIQSNKESRWSSRREFVSKNYLSDVNDLLEVR